MYRTVFALVVTLLGSSTAVFAQHGYGRGQGPGAHYDPATEVSLTGTVEEVKTVPAPGRGPGGVPLMVRAEGGVMEVLLGPAWFVTSKGMDFAKGDNITVTGKAYVEQARGCRCSRGKEGGQGSHASGCEGCAVVVG